MNYHREKQVAIAAVTAATKLCQQVKKAKADQTLQKADASPVTVADFGSQAIICQALAEAFPQDSVIGEEDASVLQTDELSEVRTQITHQVQEIIPSATPQNIIDWINWGNGKIAQRYWTLDPIDGTKGFIRGDQYAIALALVEDGILRLGILGCPVFPGFDGTRGVIFLAIQGQGAIEIPLAGGNPQTIHVNQGKDFHQLCRIQSVESNHSDRAIQSQVDQRLGLMQLPKEMDSLAKYGALARGDADFYLRVPLTPRKENIWDHGPGAIIVEEAGGKVTDLDGKPLDFSVGAKLSNNRGILASNGAIHLEVLETLAQVEKELGV